MEIIKALATGLLSAAALPAYLFFAVLMIMLAGWAAGEAGLYIAIFAAVIGPFLIALRYLRTKERRLAERLNASAAQRGLHLDFVVINTGENSGIGIDGVNYEILVMDKTSVIPLPLTSVREFGYPPGSGRVEFQTIDFDRPLIVFNCSDEESRQELRARFRALCDKFRSANFARSVPAIGS